MINITIEHDIPSPPSDREIVFESMRFMCVGDSFKINGSWQDYIRQCANELCYTIEIRTVEPGTVRVWRVG